MLRIIPEMMKLKSYRTVYGLVASMIKDDRLRQVFTFQPLLVGGNPFDTTSIYLLIHWLERKWGVFFPKGGTGALVQALVSLLADLDVEIEYNANVSEIVVGDDGRVRGVKLVDGREFTSSLVVANADPTTVYERLIKPQHRKKHRGLQMKMRRQSMGLFVGYFGTDRKYDDVSHHTIILGKRYKGLLDDIFHKRILADDFSLYLHRPTASDPSLAPPGHDAFYVLSPVPNLQGNVNWEVEEERYRNRILDVLERDHLPDLRKHLTVNFSVDPRMFRDRLQSVDGAAFGIEPVLRQSAYFRYHNKSEDVDGLYFVGAGTHPGAGVPGVLTSAKVLERVLPVLEPSQRVPLRAQPIRRAA
jgi:phytoene desaturase